MKMQRLTVYLMKTSVTTFQAALDKAKSSTVTTIPAAKGLDGLFVYEDSNANAPQWITFITPALTKRPRNIRSQSAAGLLLLKVEERIFAFTFSYGRKYLDLSQIEEQFGLRVTLNTVDPGELRSLDTKSYEDMVVSVSTQVSKTASLPTFGVDVHKDILRSATGEPRDSSFASRLTGSDSAVINKKISVDQLPSLCSKLLKAFKSTDYKANFEWIDHLKVVSDQNLIEKLDRQLVAQLEQRNTTSIHLAMPELIAWEDISGFKIAGAGRHVFEELDIDEYLENLGASVKPFSTDNLRSRSVSIQFSRSGNDDKRWSLYKCIVTEQRVDGKLYVLIEGRWLAVNESLVAEVDEFIDDIPESTFPLPPANQGEIEADYNTRAVEENSDLSIKFDAKNRNPTGARSPIEFCDILTTSGDIIHVKRTAASSTLSHLFSQGTVSGETFLSDGAYREKLRKIVADSVPDDDTERWYSLIPGQAEPVDSLAYCVTYAVITSKTGNSREWLPFFSKLNLMHHGKSLRRMGYKMALRRVPLIETQGA